MIFMDFSNLLNHFHLVLSEMKDEKDLWVRRRNSVISW